LTSYTDSNDERPDVAVMNDPKTRAGRVNGLPYPLLGLIHLSHTRNDVTIPITPRRRNVRLAVLTANNWYPSFTKSFGRYGTNAKMTVIWVDLFQKKLYRLLSMEISFTFVNCDGFLK
jgi:hypothetical protein